jgi:hypothetical protein
LLTRQDSAELFALLAAAYPKEPMTAAQMALYEAFWADSPVEVVRAAVVRHIAQSPWFPRISELLALIHEGDALDADAAWAEVQRQIRAVGYYGQPTWSHPAIAAAVEALGWDTLCRSTNPEADRAHSVRFYAMAQKREQARRQWAALPERVRQALVGAGIGTEPARRLVGAQGGR